MNLYNKEYIVVLGSHNGSIYLYNKFRRMGYPVEIVSTPCSISAGCTQSVKFNEKYLDKVKEYLINNKIVIRGIYEIYIENRSYKYRKIF